MNDTMVDVLDELADEKAIDRLFETILGRPAGNKEFLARASKEHSLEYWVHNLISSDEFKNRFCRSNFLVPISPKNGGVKILQTLADGETVDELFKLILRRPIGGENAIADNSYIGNISYWVDRLLNSDEFRHRFADRFGLVFPSSDYIPNREYRTPSVSPISLPSSVIIVGSCMTASWQSTLELAFPDVRIMHQIFNNASELDSLDDQELRKVAFQIVQIPLRSILSETDYFAVPYSEEGRARLRDTFDTCLARLKRNLDAALKYNRQTGLPSFVLNFATPQANPMGRLLPRYDLCNPCFFIEELNRELSRMIEAETGVYLIDYNEIICTFGKRFVSDDATTHLNHGAFIGSTFTINDITLTPSGSVGDIFAPRIEDATVSIFKECLAAYNTISPSNKIKLVVFDLDGTLWRGVAAESEVVDGHLTEGWPLGVLEAAAFLKKRGILLAIASKNDPATAATIWDRLYGARFPISQFAVVKISWEQKTESMRQILAETNLLPANCLFVDDNPVERDKMRLAYPDMHIIDGPIMTWRRTLLWATELQTHFVSKESASRTESIQMMARRESLKREMTETEYLTTLGVNIRLDTIRMRQSPNFARALELINKTNQFNTTGRRWTEAQILDYLATGGYILTADVNDRMSEYGLTAVMLCREGEVTQFVMSCRVFGLRVEFALLNQFLLASGQQSEKSILFAATPKNGPSRTFLRALGIDTSEVTEGSTPRALTFPRDYRLPEGSHETVDVVL